MIGGAPNGYFLDGILWWGETLQQHVWVAKGFEIHPPDLSEASISQRNAFKSMLMAFGAALGDEYHAQWQWYCTSDYGDEIDKYDAITEMLAGEKQTKWCRFVRKDRMLRSADAMERGELRKERLRLFLSKKIDARLPATKMSRASQSEFLDRLIEVERGNFLNFLDILRGLFHDTRVDPMGDLEHFAALRRYYNPSADELSMEELSEELDVALTIQENVARSDITKHPDCSFVCDGSFQNILVVTRWPKTTFPGIYRSLSGLGFLSYDITLNVHPLSIRSEMAKEERLIERLQGDFMAEQKHSLLTALRKKEAKVEALAGGFTLPYEVLYQVRVWDQDPDGLVAKTNAIKNAIGAMGGAQHYQVAMFTSAKRLYWQASPGWIGGRYTYRNIYAEHEYLADLIPFSSTFTGHLDRAEAIYDGANRNLVGVRLFEGDTPQHACLLGMTGAGKSVFVTDLLSQTSHQYDYTVLVEEGLSYGIYTRTEGCTPIILRPDGDITINYLDTGGLPLTALHRSGAAALALRMVGFSDSHDTNTHRMAMLSEYIGQLYEDSAREWLKQNRDQAESVARTAYGIELWRKRKMPPGSSYLEGFVDFRDVAMRDESQAREWLLAASSDQITEWAKSPDGEQCILDHVYSEFSPEEYPQHAGLTEMLMYGAMGHHEEKEVGYMASALSAWNAQGGTYGRLFDGVTNIDLTGRVAHFELGYIPESAAELKSAAGFLITQFARQHIVTLPRGAKKRIVFEEVARFLDVPGGEKIVAESYAQLRKFSCVVLSVVQQYARFQQSAIRPTIIANSKVYFLMRQNDAQDLEEIGKDIGLTTATKEAIRSYPLPEQQSEGARFSSVTYVAQGDIQTVCGTLRSYCSPEMLYCSSSNGSVFDQRAKALAGYEDATEGIYAEVDKQAEATGREAAEAAGKARTAAKRRRKQQQELAGV